MSKKTGKKGEAPKTSPKHAEAELRKMLFSELEQVEKDAREVLDVVNKLRHGNLDYIAKIEDATDKAEGIASALDALENKLMKEAK